MIITTETWRVLLDPAIPTPYIRPSAHFMANHPAFTGLRHAQALPSPAREVQPDAAAVAAAAPEFRVDPADGAAYTEAEFGAFYGGWASATAAGASPPPAFAPISLDVAALREGLQAEGDEWLEEGETALVLSEEWAEHFARGRPKPEKQSKAKKKQRGPKGLEKAPMAPPSAPQSAPREVAPRELVVTPKGAAAVAALEKGLRARPDWPLYPEVPITLVLEGVLEGA
jgi:hypothetical protein